MMVEPKARVSDKFLDIKVGETLSFETGVDSGRIHLTLLHKTGQRARVLVQAPDAVRIGKPAKRTG